MQYKMKGEFFRIEIFYTPTESISGLSFTKREIKWRGTVPQFVALCAMCALSPLCTWPHLLSWKTGSFPVPEIFISPSLFHTCTDVYVCFLWGLVWCRGRILFLLPWFVCFFFSHPLLSFPVSVTLSCSLMSFHSLSLLCQLLLQRKQMSILSNVSCTNHPHTDSAEKAGTMHVQWKYPRMPV